MTPEKHYVYEESFKIRSSEVTPEGKVKLESVCDYLQETAGNHALKLNFDISQLQKRNLTWVLHRLHIQMDEYPSWRDTIMIKTWPSSGETVKAYRDFQILTSDKHEIGRALSYWLILNIESRRPVRIPEGIIKMTPKNVSHVLDIQHDRLPELSKIKTSKIFRARRNDLDINQHVNNIHYIEWALEALPADQRIVEIDMEFYAECLYGEKVLSDYQQVANPGKNLHRIRRTTDDKILALARTHTR